VTNKQPSRGFQFSLSWDPAKLQCNSVDEGTYFRSFAAANDGDLYIVPSVVPDNNTGVLPKANGAITYIAVAMTGAQGVNIGLGVTGSGDTYVLHMSVKSGASGIANLTLGNTKVVDVDGKNLNATVQNGKVTISQ